MSEQNKKSSGLTFAKVALVAFIGVVGTVASSSIESFIKHKAESIDFYEVNCCEDKRTGIKILPFHFNEETHDSRLQLTTKSIVKSEADQILNVTLRIANHNGAELARLNDIIEIYYVDGKKKKIHEDFEFTTNSGCEISITLSLPEFLVKEERGLAVLNIRDLPGRKCSLQDYSDSKPNPALRPPPPR